MPERRHQIEDLYHRALECDERHRDAFLRDACAGDEALRREVQSLLKYAADAEPMMESPAIAIAAESLRTQILRMRAGQQIGSYEIVSFIGAGGMGEVYKARDMRLNRIVAVKVLQLQMSEDPDARTRFEREAQAIAALNHPNICILHDIGRHDDTDFLVMEFIDGEPLAERLKRGPLPLDDALKHATDIADALDKAHRHGITHRDLKPGNIMLAGTAVKLLDFGLAKLRTSAVSSFPMARPDSEFTAAGMILGTPQYMSPEQLEGANVDERTDIFAFGSVLYEMITGKKAFEGDSTASLIGAILKDEPTPVSALRPQSPPALDRLISRCLAKDREERWQTMRDLCHELKWIRERPAGAPVRTARRRSLPITFLIPAAAILMLLALAVWQWTLRRPATESTVVHLLAAAPPGVEIRNYPGGVAISPDGNRLAFVGTRTADGFQQLYVRPLASSDAKPLAGTEGADAPFFSPDGQWIGFFAGGKLKKVSVSSGAIVNVCDAVWSREGSWGPDDTIYFAGWSNIKKVSASGGMPEIATVLDRAKGEEAHSAPQMLPNGAAILFTVRTGWGWDEFQIQSQSLETGERHVLVQGGRSARYVASGHLVYYRGSNAELMAVPFDLKQLAVTGQPVASGKFVRSFNGFSELYDVSSSGSLVYLAGDPQWEDRRLVWVDRNKSVEPLAAPPRPYMDVRVSPDGRYAALQIRGSSVQIWIYDFAKSTLQPVPSAGTSIFPVWTPDSSRVVYTGIRKGLWTVMSRAMDGSGTEQELIPGTESVFPLPGAWTPDAKTLLLQIMDSGIRKDSGGSDLFRFSENGDGKPEPVFRDPAWDCCFNLSHDGRWLAYTSTRSGKFEIYVEPYPPTGARWHVSKDGGLDPRWSRDGRELFYFNGSKFMAVETGGGSKFEPKPPRLLFDYEFEEANNNEYDISPDGKRFLMLQRTDAERPATQINVVVNWMEELKRLVVPALR